METLSSTCCGCSCAKRKGAASTTRRTAEARRNMLQITLMAEAAISAASAALERNELFIFLLAPLPFQKVVIAASRPVGIFVADAGTRLVDRTTARLLVEEHADRTVDLVLLMPQDGFLLHHLRELRAR